MINQWSLGINDYINIDYYINNYESLGRITDHY